MAESNYRISLVLQLHDRMTAALNKIDNAARKVEDRTRRLDRATVSPTVRLIDRASQTISRVGAGIHALSSRTWNMTIRARDMVSGVIGRIKSSLFSLQGMAAVALGALGAGKLWDATAGAAMTWETQAVSMEHWLKGNKALAQEVTGWLEQFAAATPFEMGDLFPAMSRAIGVSDGDIKMAERMVKLAADMAGLTPGKTVQDAMEALADAQMGEFERMKEFNMKFSKEQMDAIGGFAGFLTEAESKFAGGADKLSQTAIGRLSTITDTIKTLFRRAGMGMLEAIKPRLDRIVAWFDGNKDKVERWKDVLMRFGQEGAERFLNFFERAFTRIGRILDDPKFQKLDFWGKVKFIIDDISAGIKDWLDSGGRDKIVAVGREIGGFLFKGIKMGVTEALKGLGKLNLEALRKPTAENIGSAALADILAIGAGSALLGPVFRLGKGAVGLGRRILGRGATAGAGVAAEAAAETAATAAKGFNLGQLLREWFVTPASKRALEPIKRTVIPGTPEQIFRYRGFIPGAPEVEAFREAGTAARTVGGGWAPLRYIGRFGKVGDFLSRWALPITLAAGAAEVALARPEERVQTGLKVGGRIAGGLAGASLGAKVGAGIGTLVAPGIGTAIGGAVGGLGGGIAGAFGGEAIVKKLSDLVKQVNFDALTDKAAGSFNDLNNRAAQSWDKLKANTSEMFTAIRDTVSGRIQEAVEGASAWFRRLPENIGFTIGFIAGKLVQLPGWIASLPEQIGNYFSQMYTAAVQWTEQTVNGIITWFSGLPGQVSIWWQQMVNSVAIWGQQLWTSAVAWASQTVGGIAAWWSGLPEQVSNWWAGVWGAIENWASNTYSSVVNWFSGIPGMIEGWVSSAVDRITGLASSAWERIKSLGGRIAGGYSAGYEAAQPHALGGILTRPHLGLVAEAGPEAVIPLSERLRPRALALWQETGRRLGVQQFEMGGFTAPVAVAGAGMGAPTINLNFDLAGLVGQITVQGREDLEQSADQIAALIAAKLKAIFYNLPG